MLHLVGWWVVVVSLWLAVYAGGWRFPVHVTVPLPQVPSPPPRLCIPEQVTVTSRRGTERLPVPLASPASPSRVTWEVTQPFGAGVSVALGDGVVFDRYGILEGTGVQTRLLPQPAPEHVTLTALGGKFSHEGEVVLTVTPEYCVGPGR